SPPTGAGVGILDERRQKLLGLFEATECDERLGGIGHRRHHVAVAPARLRQGPMDVLERLPGARGLAAGELEEAEYPSVHLGKEVLVHRFAASWRLGQELTRLVDAAAK